MRERSSRIGAHQVGPLHRSLPPGRGRVGEGGRTGGGRVRLSTAALLLALALARPNVADTKGDLLDAAAWQAVPAEGVELHIAAERGPQGQPALRLDYDFHGRGGWAAARRRLEIDLPEDYELRFLLRGAGPPNHLEVKLVDPSGDNVWWHVKRDVAWPAAWTPVRIKKRQIAFAWGPRGGGELRRTGALELTVTAGSGGQGTVWIAGLALVPRAPVPVNPGPLRATANSSEPDHPAALAVDGDSTTAWRAAGPRAELTVDLGAPREFGGLTLFWEEGRVPRRFRVDLSEDGETWTPVRTVERGGFKRSDLLLTESEARFVRLKLEEPAGNAGFGLDDLAVRSLAFGASPNAFFEQLARSAPRGAYPPGFSGTQSYWTVVGADGDPEEALFSEYGTLETGERGFSIEPFVLLDGRLWSWADVEANQSLADGDLPIPTVTWPLPHGRLEITALATEPASGRPLPGEIRRSALFARYRLQNLSRDRLRGRLFLAARPFQVNPPQQFLNVEGGVAPLSRLACDGAALQVEGEPRLAVHPAPAACGAMAFDEGLIYLRLAAGRVPDAPAVEDGFGYASAALAWDFDLPRGETQEVILGAPFPSDAREAVPRKDRSGQTGEPRVPPPWEGEGWRRGEDRRGAGPDWVPTWEATSADVAVGPARFAVLAEETRHSWREKLDHLTLDLPPEAAPLAQVVRSSLAYILIHRDGPAIQPGSRAYARSWIRDGALTGTALLRLNQPGPARAFAEWFAGYQYPDGKVPCCVDRRGADPVAEHDSHGELIHLIAEVFRYTGDRAFAERLFPHVARAVDHIEALRQSRRTAAYQEGEKRAFFGLLPESISHEGYSAKPVHSYWDDLFAYRGLDDAVDLAAALGHPDLATAWAARRDEFRRDLLASLAFVREHRGIDYLPGSADLADFDSTSTTIALDPAGLEPYLSRGALTATFERFYRELTARRDGAASWDGYTPYEIRHVGAFLRLGWKARAHELLAFYLADRRPLAWNGWPEVVKREPRKPGFLGDLPHGWVASDFIRSALDLFAYERRQDRSLVLAAGVPESWLERLEGVAVSGLATPWGPLGYHLLRRGRGVRYAIEAGSATPPGGLVLTWPLAGRPARALVDGRPVVLAADGTVVVHPTGRAGPAGLAEMAVDLLPGPEVGPRDGNHER